MLSSYGKWSRLVPTLFRKNVELKPREVLPLEILAYFPGSETFRVIDVEWVSQDNVPVTLSKKRAIYTKNEDGHFYFDKLEFCLFNSSNARHAKVDIYSIEEFYFTDGNISAATFDLDTIKKLYLPNGNIKDI
ncbi:hypothetical protein [Bacillus cereus]|uniref:hypothetical protein n=1 Tax=Bacillus cereus TaxID=1396 RepID=UPI000BF7D68C|nr:hypothetical protein [Bacillus cereus]PES08137.1 hypothetical protein CN494_30480 [Bacillus cereus]